MRIPIRFLFFFVVVAAGNLGAEPQLTKPYTSSEVIFEEVGGMVAVEAEHFFKQENTDVRAWYLTTADKESGIQPDADPNHVAGAGGGAYLEILPDTRKNHDEKLIQGENFINEPGKMAVLSYKVHFNTAGKYYVWARTHSTGTEDNGLHVGIDGGWPESGQRMQWTAKRHWAWASKQRTQKVHGGVPGLLFLQVEEPGEHIIQFSMREDGFEFDQWLMTTDPDFKPEGAVAPSKVKSGTIPKAFKTVAAPPAEAKEPPIPAPAKAREVAHAMSLADFPDRNQVYVDDNRWFAINPNSHKSGSATGAFPFNEGVFDLTLHAVGENDGRSTYQLVIDGELAGEFVCPLGDSGANTTVGPKFTKTFEGLRIGSGAMVEVKSTVGSEDGSGHSRARWSHISVKSADGKPVVRNRGIQRPAEMKGLNPKAIAANGVWGKRSEDGDGEITVAEGDHQIWHKITLTLDGPFAHERDGKPNPFTDYRFDVTFTHESGSPSYTVPGYFAADGNAGETSAESGTKWRAHFAPDKTGKWNYKISFSEGDGCALDKSVQAKALAPFDGKQGSLEISESDKKGRDLRGKGRLQYVGKHHLQFAGSKEWFVKAGADAPETFLGYADFDGTVANKAGKAPLKTWEPHIGDWKPGDPSWKDGKGKGMIGAINYLSGKGCNVFSFLPYNAGGDGDNVWPFIIREAKFHYDCSKLDQWGIVFDHGTAKGMYLHFKLQETENDDGKPESLDGGNLGPERKLYCREMVARFGHNLALNWNLGEENTQTTKQQRDMAKYIADLDPYDHLIVVHTYPNKQDDVYRPLLGDGSVLRGASLQNSNIKDCHHQVVKWRKESAEKGVPWVIGFDEPGTAGEGMPADEGYPGMPKNFNNPSVDDTRKYALWGTLMAGGGGVEYYFGYKLPQNDLLCEDWRSRDKSWDYCRIALDFFNNLDRPLGEMTNLNERVGNQKNDNSAYCFGLENNDLLLVYLPNGGSRQLDLKGDSGKFSLQWFNPRNGESQEIEGDVNNGGKVALKAPGDKEDWLAVVRKR